jgi:hypothetical protein
VTERFDRRLATQFDKAHKAKDEATRKAELAKAKALLIEQIKYMSSDPLIADLEGNPFVKVNLKAPVRIVHTEMAKLLS